MDINVSKTLFKLLLGREPKHHTLESLNKLSLLKQCSNLLASEEYQSDVSKQRRASQLISPEEYSALVAEFGGAVENKNGERTYQEVLDRTLLPFFTNSLSGGKVKFVQSKSLPRSGHHFLVSLLTKYFKEEMHYCESYQNEFCCKSRPCQKPFNSDLSNKYMLQKSHDFGLKDDMSTNCLYIIQHREPVARIQSNFELALKTQSNKYSDNIKSFEKFALADAKGSIGFYNKWFNAPEIDTVVVNYDDLVLNTSDTLTQIIKRITSEDEVCEARLAEALVGKENKVNTHNSPKSKRLVEEHRYYTDDLAAKIYEIIKQGLEIEPSSLSYF